MLNEQQLSTIIDERINKYKDYYWVFFDTETSGLKAQEDQLLEIAAIAVDADFYTQDKPAIIAQYHVKSRLEQDTKVRIRLPHIPKGKGDLSKVDLLKMTRYGMPKDEFKKMAFLKESESVKRFIDFLNGLEKTKPVLLVAHNADFDVGYLKEKAAKYNVGRFDFKYIDTLKIVQEVFYPLLRIAQQQDLLGIFDKLKSQTHPFVLKKGGLTARLGHISNALDVKAEGWHSAIFDIKMLIDVTRKIVSILVSNREQNIQETTMKISEERLKQIIKEELEKVLNEEGVLSTLGKGAVGKFVKGALTAANIVRAGELATSPSRAPKEISNKPAIHAKAKSKKSKKTQSSSKLEV